jgi:transposase-like protein
MDEPTPQLLKTDTRGRVRTPRERREALLDEFERSGASASQFAKLSGVKYQTFAGWVQRRRRRCGAGGVQRVEGVRLLEAMVEERTFARGSQTLRVELPGGARIELTDASQATLAAALLRELAQASRSAVPC